MKNRQILVNNNSTDEYDLFFAVCVLAAKRRKIKLIRPPLSEQRGDLFDFIYKIAEASEVRVRKVALGNEWWQKDGGPLIGFYQNEPCALLPRKMGGYLLVDIKRNRRLIVSKKIAENISAEGFCFYLALPGHIQQIRDLFRFSLEQIHNDFWIFATAQTFMSLFILIIPVTVGYLFSVVLPNADLPLLLEMFFLLLINAGVVALFSINRMRALIRIKFKLEAATAPAIWDRILKLPLHFFRKFSSGDLMFRAGVVGDIQNTFIRSALLFLANGLTLIFSLILLFYYSTILASMTLALALLVILVMTLTNYRQLRFLRELYFHFGQYIHFVLEVINGISKIRVTNAASRIFKLWMTRLSKRNESELQIKWYRMALEIFIAFMTVISPTILYALTIKLSLSLSLGDFVTFNAIYTLFFLTLFRITADLSNMGRIAPLWKKSQVIFNAGMEYETGHADPGELSGDIVISHINFRYHRDDQPLFKNFSLSIRPGEFIAIVGPSGSGKSTLFRILLGFEEPESGEIYYNGIHLKMLKLAAVRRQIGVVIQSSTLIPGTIFANIAGNNAQITRIEAWEIAEKVGLNEFIKNLPMQMDTLITEGPITLSGGERQRLVLARALAQKPKVLILDEATSALDNTTQALVHNYLNQLKVTQIIAAHRLSTIINANRIVVMEKGAIVQMGTFAELMATTGLFAQMARRQL